LRPSGENAGVTALSTTPVRPVETTSLPSARAKSLALPCVYASRAKRELASANDPSGYGPDQVNLRLLAAVFAYALRAPPVVRSYEAPFA
jgi:hypothetical protein